MGSKIVCRGPTNQLCTDKTSSGTPWASQKVATQVNVRADLIRPTFQRLHVSKLPRNCPNSLYRALTNPSYHFELHLALKTDPRIKTPIF